MWTFGNVDSDLKCQLSGKQRKRARSYGLIRSGWSVKRTTRSHKTISRPGWPDTVYPFHDNDEIGPRMLARIAKRTGLTSEDL
jgi:predicted RNA binding protein YcfA (HicA-like mRNA interferase family)